MGIDKQNFGFQGKHHKKLQPHTRNLAMPFSVTKFLMMDINSRSFFIMITLLIFVVLTSHLQASMPFISSSNLHMIRIKYLWMVSSIMSSWYWQRMIAKHWYVELHASMAVGFLGMSFRKSTYSPFSYLLYSTGCYCINLLA